MKTYKIACIPSDGIGKEVIPAGQEVLARGADNAPNFPFRAPGDALGGSLGLFVQALLAGDLDLLVDDAKFRKQSRGRLVHRRDHTRHRNRITAGRCKHKFLGPVTPMPGQGLLKREFPFGPAGKQPLHRLAD